MIVRSIFTLFVGEAWMRLTVINLQTFGDYVLRSPFFHQLFLQYPGAVVTVVTNPKGASLFPLLDSRLRLVIIAKQESRLSMVRKMLAIPKADALYLVDHSMPSYVCSLFVRAHRKFGWAQSISRLYLGPQQGFQDSKRVSPALEKVMGFLLGKKRVRYPEEQYEGHVELALLKNAAVYPRLAQYRSKFSMPPAPRCSPPAILFGALASWTGRQLTIRQWCEILLQARTRFPTHRFIVDCSDELMQALAPATGFERMERSDTLDALFTQVASTDAVVCSDSFLCHLASLYDVPAVVFFGPASPHRFAPTAPGSSIVFHRPSCSPCRQRRGTDPCVEGHRECLSFQQITADEVCDGLAKAIAARECQSQQQSPAPTMRDAAPVF